MTERRQKYTAEFKRDAVKLVTEQGYAIAEAARNLGHNGNMLGRWKRELATEGEVTVGEDHRQQPPPILCMLICLRG